MKWRTILSCFAFTASVATSAAFGQTAAPARLELSGGPFHVTTMFTPFGAIPGSLTVRVRAIAADGSAVPHVSVTFTSTTSGCGSFEGASDAQGLTDANGAVDMPVWTANLWPPVDCVIDAKVTDNPAITVPIVVRVSAVEGIPVRPPPTATRVVYVDAEHEFDATAGQALPTLRAATVDDSGSRVPFQRVFVATTCDSRLGLRPFNLENFSDAAGIVTVHPQWFPSPSWGKCQVTVFLAKDFYVLPLAQIPQVSFVFYDPSVVWSVDPVDGVWAMTVHVGQVVTGLRFALLNSRQAPVANAAVNLSALECGTFGGATPQEVVADASGIVVIPAWTAPLHADLCRIFILRTGVISVFTIDVRDPSIQDGDTFIRFGTAPDGFLSRGNPPYTKFRLVPNDAGGFSFSLFDYCLGCAGLMSSAFAEFAPPGGSALVPGSYTPLQRYADSGGAKAGLLAGVARGFMESCHTVNGSFVVHELVLAADGWPSRFAADFVQFCNGDPAPQVGGVRFNSTVPYPGPSAQTAAVRTARGSLPSGQFANLTIEGVTPSCTIETAGFHDPAQLPLATPPDPSLMYTDGYLDSKTDRCGSGQPVTFSVDVGKALPPTAQWWIYGPTQDDRTAHWHVVPSTVDGSRIIFTIADGGIGDGDMAMNGSVEFRGMVAIPNGPLQDLWWAGPAENGWGMSLVQHRDVIFGNLFVYDAQGNPVWYAMPSGSWNAEHTVYTGALFLPKGSPYFAYDASKFDIGAAAGTARLTFNDVNSATLEYTLHGVTGQKNLRRTTFGPVAPPTDTPLGDLWWAGPSQNGWGLALLQQYGTLFGIWFTYDAAGKPTWFVMPNLEFVSRDIYRGTIYRPEGAPWLGVSYDATRHRTVDAGTFVLRFGDAPGLDFSVDGKSGSIPISRIPF